MEPVRHELFHCMGIPVHCTLIGVSETQSAEDAAAVERVFKEWDRTFSRFRPDSELAVMNAHTGRWNTVSREMFEVIDACVRLSRDTDGLFDASVGSYLAAAGYGLPGHFQRSDAPADYRSIELDADNLRIRCAPGQILEPAGIVKGMAIDAGAAELNYATAWMINAGGDILTHGAYPDDRWWRVAIQHPSDTHAAAAVIRLRDEAIATSGDYEVRWATDTGDWHHQIDMRTRRPTVGLKSVSVIAPTARQADTLASVGFLGGLTRGRAALDAARVPYLFIDDTDTMHMNTRFRERQN